MTHDYSAPSPKHTAGRMRLNADLADLVEQLDTLANRAAELAKRVPSELADPDFNATLVEDLTRLRVNVREAWGSVWGFVIPVKSSGRPAAEAGR